MNQRHLRSLADVARTTESKSTRTLVRCSAWRQTGARPHRHQAARSGTRRHDRLSDPSPTSERDALAAFDDRLFELDDDPATSLDRASRRYIDAHPEEFFAENEDEELAAATLLDVARGLVNDPPPRRLDVAQELLTEAISRSKAGGSGRAFYI